MEAADASIDERFRTAMAGVATPVTIVTAFADGNPHGTTVSAFTSLSIDPPMILVCLDRGSDLLGLLRSSQHFGVNVLASHQSSLALTFAGKGKASKFSGVTWNLYKGLPRLPDSSGWLDCEVAELVDGGDHIVVLGNVLDVQTSSRAPLVYHNRFFGTHATTENDSG